MKKIKWYHVGVIVPYGTATLSAYYFADDRFGFWFLLAAPFVLLFSLSLGTWIEKILK